MKYEIEFRGSLATTGKRVVRRVTVRAPGRYEACDAARAKLHGLVERCVYPSFVLGAGAFGKTRLVQAALAGAGAKEA